MDESLSVALLDGEGTGQTQYLCLFNDKRHFLEQKQPIQMDSATLRSPFGWSAQGRGCCRNELGVTLLPYARLVAETDSELEAAARLCWGCSPPAS